MLAQLCDMSEVAVTDIQYIGICAMNQVIQGSGNGGILSGFHGGQVMQS